MRVLHLARPAAGGVLRFLQSVLPRLEREGVRCDVACPAAMHSSLAPLRTLRWEITDRPRLLNDLYCALQANRWQRDYDLLHAHGLRAAGTLAIVPPRLWVFSLHNLPPERLPVSARWLLRRAAHSAAQIMAVSQAVLEGWLHHFPNTAEKSVLVSGGVDVDTIRLPQTDRSTARRQWNLPEDAPVALCVARLMEDKGVDVLLRALAYVPECFALVVGEGPQRESLLRLVSELGVGERVRFTGYLPVLDSAWAACDVAVVPSRREGLGLFALEAMAAQKPVIASAVGGLKETVRSGECGWLVPPNDALALADALRHAISVRESWRDMGSSAREYVMQNFTWEKTAQRMLECYRCLPRM